MGGGMGIGSLQGEKQLVIAKWTPAVRASAPPDRSFDVAPPDREGQALGQVHVTYEASNFLPGEMVLVTAGEGSDSSWP
jgi:hypothetical protein